ncbi:restriction endonuclease subunit S [Streptomyces longwoodensis]|uniref:restriction endonuclease subunit S n=1 Tax=Streptomyces longwoodensis TaxID=68231 RepID=UPI002251C75A|nr:restriction endonuclease subunit S [Streptomyces longwoodensis]MCX4995921.1 restriction endonuclease subunit S [Streptomyces longwoodensis]
MTELPPEWVRTTLAEIGVEAQPGFASGKHNSIGSGILHLRPMNITRDGRIDVSDARYVDDSTDRRVTNGDLLFNNTNSPALTGKTALVTGLQTACAYSNHMTRLRTPQGVDAAFLARQLHWLWSRGYFQSVLNNHVNQASVATKRLLETPIILPPYEEQRRIITYMEELFSRLDAGAGAIQKGQLLLHRLDRLTTELAIRNRLHPVATTSEIDASSENDALFNIASKSRAPDPFELPAGWKYASLEELVANGRKAAYGVLVPGPDTPDGVPFVRVGDLENGSVNTSALKHIDPEIALRYPRTVLSGGELLISLVGTIGRVALAPHSTAGANVARAIGVFPLNEELVDPRWVLTVLQSETYQRFLDGTANEVARKTLNLADARKCRIPLPPRQLQAKFVDEVYRRRADTSRLRSATADVKIRIDHLRAVVLSASFAGRLSQRVPTDTPAEKFLEKIRAQRSAAQGSRRGRRSTTHTMQNQTAAVQETLL